MGLERFLYFFFTSSFCCAFEWKMRLRLGTSGAACVRSWRRAIPSSLVVALASVGCPLEVCWRGFVHSEQNQLTFAGGTITRFVQLREQERGTHEGVSMTVEHDISSGHSENRTTSGKQRDTRHSR